MPRGRGSQAGVLGTLIADLGDFKNVKRRTRTSLWLLRVDRILATWEEGDKGRRREWMSPRSAVDQLSWKPYQQEMLLAGVHWLKEHSGGAAGAGTGAATTAGTDASSAGAASTAGVGGGAKLEAMAEIDEEAKPVAAAGRGRAETATGAAASAATAATAT